MKTMKRLLALLLALAMVMPNCMTIASAFTEEEVLEAVELAEEVSETQQVEELPEETEAFEELGELVEEEISFEEQTDSGEALNAEAEEPTAPEAEAQEEPAFEELTYATEQEVGNDEMYAAYFQNVLWPRDMAVFGITGRQALENMGQTAADALLAYDALKPILESVAAGSRTSTYIVLGAEYGIGQFSGNDLSLTMDALLADLPYDMYWYDKVTGVLAGQQTVTNTDGTFAGYKTMFFFNVAEDYRTEDAEVTYTSGSGVDYYCVTSGYLTGAASATVDAALQVVADVQAANPDATDYEKILAYKNWIRSAVTYDSTAANGGDRYFVEEIDPWQVIHVFDGDPSTNVVCEGYSKALQYLCDLTTTFQDPDTYVYCVTGDLYVGDVNRGGHMWNIVSLDGGKYLADLTNCGGYDVFLVGGEPGESGYAFDGLGYIYDADTQDFYDSDMLTLSTSNYIKEETDNEETGSSDAVTYDPTSLHDALYAAGYGGTVELNNQVDIGVEFGQGYEEPGIFRIPEGVTLRVNSALNLMGGLKLIVEKDAVLELAAEEASVSINGGSELCVEGSMSTVPGTYIHVGAQNDANAAIAGKLTVSEGANVSSNSWVNVANATAVVDIDGVMVQATTYLQNAGSVVVDGELVMKTGLALEETGSLALNNSLVLEGGFLDASKGTVTGSGTIRANVNVEGTDVVGMENLPEEISCMAMYGGIQNVDALEAALKAEVSGYEELGVVVVSAITIPEGKTLTVPANCTLTVGATQDSTGSLTIVSGAGLSVEGILRLVGGASVAVKKGGTLEYVNDGQLVNINGTVTNENTAENAAQDALIAALEAASAGSTVTLDGDVELTDTVTVPEGVTLVVPDGVTLTGSFDPMASPAIWGFLQVDGSLEVSGDVVTNGPFTVNGSMTVKDGGSATINYIIIVNGSLSREEGGSITVGENGTVQLGYSADGVAQQSVFAPGEARLRYYGADGAVAKAMLNYYESCLMSEDTEDDYLGLILVVDGGTMELTGPVYLWHNCEVTVRTGATLKTVGVFGSSGNIAVMSGGTLEVPENTTFHNSGYIDALSGSYVVNNGIIRNNQYEIDSDTGDITSYSAINIEGSYSGSGEVVIQNNGDGSIQDTVGTAIPNSVKTLEYDPHNTADVETALGYADTYGKVIINADVNVVVDGDWVIPANVELNVSSGFTMTVNGTVTNNGTVHIYGKLVAGEGNWLGEPADTTTLSLDEMDNQIWSSYDANGKYLGYTLTREVTMPNKRNYNLDKQIEIGETGSFTVTSGSTLKVTTTLYVRGNLTVEEGGTLNVATGAMIIVNEGTLNVESGANFVRGENRPVMVFPALGGEANGLDMDNVQANWQPEDLAGLKAALAEAGNYGYNQIMPQGDISLETMTIPANVMLNLNYRTTNADGETSGALYTVPSGAVVTVEGKLYVKEYNTLYVEEGGTVMVTGELYNYGGVVNQGDIFYSGTVSTLENGDWQGNEPVYSETGYTESDLLEALAAGGTVTLEEDLTIRGVVEIPSGTTLVVAENVTLTNEGEIDIAGILQVKGTLENNLGIFVIGNGGLSVTGTVINNRFIEMVGVNAWANFQDGSTYEHGSFEEDGEVYSADFVAYFNGEGCGVTGVATSNLFLHCVSTDPSIFQKISMATNRGGYAGWSVGIDGTMTVDNMVDMTNVFVFDGAELIINTTGDHSYANRKLIVQPGGTLTVNGNLTVYGTLSVHEGATLNNNGTLVSGAGMGENGPKGQIILDGEYNHGEGAELQFETYMADELTFNDVPNIDNSLKTIISRIDNADEVLRAALDFGWNYGWSEVFLSGDHNLDWNLHMEGNRRLHIQNDVTISADMDMTGGAFLAVMPGATLTANAAMWILNGSVVEVRGGTEWAEPAVLNINSAFHLGFENSVGAKASGYLEAAGVVNANGYVNICNDAQVKVTGTLNHNAYDEEAGVGGVIIENHGTIEVAADGVMNAGFHTINNGQVTINGELNVTTGSVQNEFGGRMDLNSGADINIPDSLNQIFAWNRGSLYNNGADLSDVCTAGIQVDINNVTEYKNIPADKIYATYFVYNEDELYEATVDQSGKGYGFVEYIPKTPITLTKDLTIPGGTLLQLWNFNENLDFVLTIPEGVTLDNDGHIIINSGTRVNSYGVLDTTNGHIDVTANNRGNENLLFGILWKQGAANLVGAKEGDNLILNGGQVVGGIMSHADLQATLEDGEKNGRGWVHECKTTLNGELVVSLPKGLFLEDTATIVVPNGATLTIDSHVGLIGGKIIVQEGGTLNLNGTLEILEGTVYIANGAAYHNNGNQWGYVTFQGDTDSYIGNYWVHGDANGRMYENHAYQENRYQMHMPIPQDFTWIFYLNEWDEENLTWVKTPIAPEDLEAGPGLVVQHVSVNDWMREPAAGYENLYPYFVQVSTTDEAEWNTDSYIAYTTDNQRLTYDIRLERNFDHGFYSEPEATDEAWLTRFEISPLDEQYFFYYIFTKDGCTPTSATVTRGAEFVDMVQVDDYTWKLAVKEEVLQNLWRDYPSISVDVDVKFVDANGNSRSDVANIYASVWTPEEETRFGVGTAEGGYVNYHYDKDSDLYFTYVWDEEAGRHNRVVTQLPEGVSFNYDENVLTLDNVKLTGLDIGYTRRDNETGETLINLFDEDLSIVLKGYNEFNSENNDICNIVLHDGVNATMTAEEGAVLHLGCDDPYNHVAGMDLTPNSTLTVDESVVIDIHNADLYLGGTLNFNGAKLTGDYSGFYFDGTANVSGGTITLNNLGAIQLNDTNIGGDAQVNLNNSVLRVVGDAYIRDDAQVDINLDEHILSDEYDYALLNRNCLTIEDNANIDIDVEGVGTERYFRAVTNYGILRQSGGTVTVFSDAYRDTDAYGAMIPAMYTSGVMELTGGELTLNGQIGYMQGWSTDWNEEAPAQELAVSGGTLNANGSAIGLYVMGHANISGGTVNAYAEGEANNDTGVWPQAVRIEGNFLDDGTNVTNFFIQGGELNMTAVDTTDNEACSKALGIVHAPFAYRGGTVNLDAEMAVYSVTWDANFSNFVNLPEIAFKDEDGEHTLTTTDLPGHQGLYLQTAYAEDGSFLGKLEITNASAKVSGQEELDALVGNGLTTVQDIQITSDVTLNAFLHMSGEGVLTVKNGATLTIPAGAALVAQGNSQIIVEEGSRIVNYGILASDTGDIRIHGEYVHEDGAVFNTHFRNGEMGEVENVSTQIQNLIADVSTTGHIWNVNALLNDNAYADATYHIFGSLIIDTLTTVKENTVWELHDGSITVLKDQILTIAEGAVLNLNGGKLKVEGTVYNHGTLNNAGAEITIAEGGAMQNLDTNLILDQGTVMKVQGELYNYTALPYSNIHNYAITVTNESILTIDGYMKNEGVLNVGERTTEGLTSCLNINGTLDNSGNIKVYSTMNVDGTLNNREAADAFDNSYIEINGNVNINGILNVESGSYASNGNTQVYGIVNISNEGTVFNVFGDVTLKSPEGDDIMGGSVTVYDGGKLNVCNDSGVYVESEAMLASEGGHIRNRLATVYVYEGGMVDGYIDGTVTHENGEGEESTESYLGAAWVDWENFSLYDPTDPLFRQMRMIPGDERSVVFYSMHWNAENMKWNYKCIIPEENSDYLSITRYEQEASPIAEYRVHVETADREDAWGKTAKITYNHYAEIYGVELNPFIVEIGRDVNQGFYSSATEHTNATWLEQIELDPYTEEDLTFYYTVTCENMVLTGEYDIYAPIEIDHEKISDTVIRLTVSHEVIEQLEGDFDLSINAKLTPADDPENIHEWGMGIYCWKTRSHEMESIADICIDHKEYRYVAEYGRWFADGELSYLPSGVNYNRESNTLTLTDAVLDSVEFNKMPGNQVIISLEGVSTIESETFHAMVFRDGIQATITGDGTLNLYSDNGTGLQNDEGEWFHCGTLVMDGEGANLTIEGNAKVNAKVAGEAYWGYDKQIGMLAAVQSFTDENDNLRNTLTIRGNATLTATVETELRDNRTGSGYQGHYESIQGFRNINVTDNATLNADTLSIRDGVFHMDGGYVNIETLPGLELRGSDVHAHYEGLFTQNGTIEISGGELTVDVTAHDLSEYNVKTSWGRGIGANDGTINITGGTIRINSDIESSGIDVSSQYDDWGQMIPGTGAELYFSDAELYFNGVLQKNEEPNSLFGYNYSMPSAIWANPESTVTFNGGTITLEKANLGLEGSTQWSKTRLTGTETMVLLDGNFVMDSGAMELSGAEIANEENFYNNALLRAGGNTELKGGTIDITNGILAVAQTLNLNGADITVTNDEEEFQGVHVAGDLTVNGGSLTASVPGGEWHYSDGEVEYHEVYPAIWVNGTLRVKGGVVNATSETTGGIKNFGELLVNGGTVNAEGNVGIANIAAESQGVLFVNGGTVNAIGASNGINNIGYLEILGGEVNATVNGTWTEDFHPTAIYNEAELDENREVIRVIVNEQTGETRPAYGLYMGAGALNVFGTPETQSTGIYSLNAPIHLVRIDGSVMPAVNIQADSVLVMDSIGNDSLLTLDPSFQLVNQGGSVLTLSAEDNEIGGSTFTLIHTGDVAAPAKYAELAAFGMSQAQLEEALANAKTSYTLTESVVISKNMTIAKELILAEGVVLTLTDGAELIADSTLTVNTATVNIVDGTVIVNGKLVNNGGVQICNGAALKNYGQIISNGSFYALDGSEVSNEGIVNLGGSEVSFAENAYYHGDEALLQVDYLVTEDEVVNYTIPTIPVEYQTLFHPVSKEFQLHDETTIRQMMALVTDGGYAGGIVWIVDKNVTITEYTRVPANVDICVGMSKTPVILEIDSNIPDSVLNIEGGVYVNPNGLNKNHKLSNNGMIYISQNGELKVQNSGKYTQSGSLTRYDLVLTENGPAFTGVVEGISNNMQTLYCNEADTAALLSSVQTFFKGQKFKNVNLRVDDLIVDEDLTIESGVSVAYAGDIIVEEGKTLTISGGLHIGSDAAAIYNNGTVDIKKGANAGIVDNRFSGNDPIVATGAKVYPAATAATIRSVTYGETVAEDVEKLTMDTVDAAQMKLSILIADAASDADPEALQRVTWTSSKKSVVNAADILYDEDTHTYYIHKDAAIGTGTTKLTATSVGTNASGKKVSDSISITVEAVKPDKLVLNPDVEDGNSSDNIVELEKNEEAQSFTIEATAQDKHGLDYALNKKNIKWTSSDTKIATVSVDDNGNANVTVKADAYGKVDITAQLTTNKDVTATIELEIRDYAPRIAATSLTVNPMLSNGTQVTLTEAYLNNVNAVSFDDIALAENELLEVEYEEDEDGTNGRIVVKYTTAEDTAPKNKTLKPTLLVQTDKGDYSYKMTVVIKSTSPAVTVKQPTKLDLFYNDSEALLNVTVKDETIESMELIDTEDFTLVETEDGTCVTYTDTLTEGFAENAKYKPDAKGTLVIYLEGYAYPVTKAVTIGTTTSSMSLSTTASSSTLYSQLQDTFEVSFQIYDKKAKTTINPDEISCVTDGYVAEMDAEGLVTVYGGDVVKVKLTMAVQQSNWMLPVNVTHQVNVNTKVPAVKLSTGTMKISNMFLEEPAAPVTVTLDTDDFEIDYFEYAEGYETDVFETTVTKAAARAEAEKLLVRYDSGTKTITAEVRDDVAEIATGSYKFRATPYVNGVDLKAVDVVVKVENNKPKVVLGAKNMKLSSLFVEQPAVMTVSTSDARFDVTSFESDNGENVFKTTATKANLIEKAEKIEVTYDSDAKQITAQWVDGVQPETGTYSYKATAYSNGISLGDVTVTVKVDSAVPTVKLGTTTAKLNTSLAGAEYLEIPVTFTDKTGYELTFAGFDVASMDDENNAVAVSYNETTGNLEVRLNDPAAQKTVFSLIPQATKKLDDQNSTIVDLKAVKLTVSPYTKTVSVSQSGKGKIDTAVADSQITYTVTKISNATGMVVGGVEVIEGNDLFETTALTPNAKGQQTFGLKLKDNAVADLKTTYQVQLRYYLYDVNQAEAEYVPENALTCVDSSVLKIKVSQSALKVTAPAVTYYQAQTEALGVTLTLTAPANAKMEHITINTAKTSKELVQALGLDGDKLYSYVERGGVTEAALEDLAVVDSGAVKAGKSYKLVLDITPVGHADNAKATQVTVTVKVLK